MLRSLSKIILVAITLFATTAPCLCWVQMLSQPGCCQEAEKRDCCCSQETKIDNTVSRHKEAILPVEWQLPELQPAIWHVDYTDVGFSSRFSSSGLNGIDIPLRSPPDLYLFHAVFRI